MKIYKVMEELFSKTDTTTACYEKALEEKQEKLILLQVQLQREAYQIVKKKIMQIATKQSASVKEVELFLNTSVTL
jgi:hypothetical protein